MPEVAWAELEPDGRTLQLALPEAAVRIFGLHPGARIAYVLTPDGRIIVSLSGGIEAIVPAMLDGLCDTEGPDSKGLVDSVREARIFLAHPDM